MFDSSARQARQILPFPSHSLNKGHGYAQTRADDPPCTAPTPSELPQAHSKFPHRNGVKASQCKQESLTQTAELGSSGKTKSSRGKPATSREALCPAMPPRRTRKTNSNISYQKQPLASCRVPTKATATTAVRTENRIAWPPLHYALKKTAWAKYPFLMSNRSGNCVPSRAVL